MFWARGMALVVLLVAGSVGPGVVFVRRLRWGPAEKLCAAVGLSLFIEYMWSFGVFLTGAGPWAYWVMTGFAIGGWAWCWRDLAGWWRTSGTLRRMVGVWVFMLAYGYVCMGLVRHFSGGMWSDDWWVHYQKIEVFMAGGARDMGRVRAIVIERPPTMNLVALGFMRPVGVSYEMFELAFVYLNLLCVLPCCLMATLMRRRAGRRLWGVAAMFVCLPLLMENATYTWTKLMSSYYVLFGIWLYLAALRKEDWGRMVAAFTCLGFACITHFVAAPYAAYVLGHYLVRVWWRRKRKWMEIVLSGIGGAGMIMTWFGWVIWRYGWREAVGANPTILYTRHYSAATNAMRITRNIIYTVIPHPLRMSASELKQGDWMGFVRDYVFLIYQSNLLFGMGSVAGFVVLYLLHERLKGRGMRGSEGGAYVAIIVAIVAAMGLVYVPTVRNLVFVLFPTYLQLGILLLGVGFVAGAGYRLIWERGRGVREEVWFWRGFVVVVPMVAVAGHDYLNYYGLGHIFFQSLVLLAVTMLAVAVWDLPGWVRWAVAGGMGVDFALGVWLQFHLEHRVFRMVGGNVDTGGLAKQAGVNWMDKVRFGYTFVGDHLVNVSGVLEGVLVLAGVWAVWRVAAGERKNLDRGVEGNTI